MAKKIVLCVLGLVFLAGCSFAISPGPETPSDTIIRQEEDPSQYVSLESINITNNTLTGIIAFGVVDISYPVSDVMLCTYRENGTVLKSQNVGMASEFSDEIQFETTSDELPYYLTVYHPHIPNGTRMDILTLRGDRYRGGSYSIPFSTGQFQYPEHEERGRC